ncbi:MAG: hypothetical protein LBP19_08515 [Treponema sp.]|nr:hypothetical protein [Treponema sp.]
MKNLYTRQVVSRLGLIAIAAVLAIGLAGCGDKDEETSDPKTLVITGITDEYADQDSEIQISIFPVGTNLEQVLSGTGFVAVADTDNVTLSGTTATVELYVPHTGPWTGSGTYDVYLRISGEDASSYFQKQGVSFSSTSTSVPIADFEAITLPDPRTLVITGIDEEYAGEDAEIRIGIFQAGTTPEEAMDETGFVAGADEDNITLDGETATAELYAPHGDVPWMGSGTYDVYLIITGGETPIYLQKGSVSFANASTEVSIDDFEAITLPDPRTLVITGLTDQYTSLGNEIQIGIFPAGTSLDDALAGTGFVAGATTEEDDITLSGTTATAALYVPHAGPWTGSGVYDVYLVVSGGETTIYLQKENVSFTSASTEVSIEAFEAITLPGGDA